MAKLFYTLTEVAAKLGQSEDQVKQLVAQGQLQQFRDRDNLMFKRDQVDALAATDESSLELSLEDSGLDDLSVNNSSDSSVTMPLTDTMIDNIDMIDEPPPLSADSAPLVDELGIEETGVLLAESGEIDLSIPDDSALSEISPSSDSSASGMALGDPSVSSPLKEQHPSDDFLSLADEPGNSLGDGLELSITGLEGAGDSGELELANDNANTLVDAGNLGDKRQSTGVSIFDANEINDNADQSAQTVISEGTMLTEELSLESVGSGSGLLDLTHESDDTSLGAELLDEIYPSNTDTGIGTGMMETTVGSTGVFDSGITLEAGSTQSGEASAILESEDTASATGFNTSENTGIDATYTDQTMEAEAVNEADATMETEQLQETYEEYDYANDPSLPPSGMGMIEIVDPVASGLNTGLLMGATISLTVCLIVVVAGISGAPSILTHMMTKAPNSLSIYVGSLAGISIVLGVVGLALGKMFKK